MIWTQKPQEETDLITQIAVRATEELKDRDSTPLVIWMMVIESWHQVCPLNLSKLLGAGLFDFLHDVCGMAQHIDPDTFEPVRKFLPRATK